jgi:hypothetical protein
VAELLALTGGVAADVCVAKGESASSGCAEVARRTHMAPYPANRVLATVGAPATESKPSPRASLAPPPMASPSIPWVPVPRPRFLIDGMMGRLTRWLRVIGVDAESTMGPGADEFVAAWRAERDEPPLPPPPPAPFVNKRGGGPVFAKVPSGGGGDGSGASGGMDVEAMVEWANRSGRILVTRDRKVSARFGGGRGGDEWIVWPTVWQAWSPQLLTRRDWCAMWTTHLNDTPAQFEHLTSHFGIT